MKHIFLTLFSVATVASASAQQTDNSKIYLNEQQQTSLSASGHTATLSVGGLELIFGEQDPALFKKQEGMRD